jgi:8-oxo-dGTP pyrophosphatase MutT (NUDIX family)
MAEILIPRPAATIMPLRDSPDGYEILMLRRNVNIEFMGGAYVFPGGALDPQDADADDVVFGGTDEEASFRLNLDRGGLAYFVASLRELFEEGGLLVACDENGAPASLDDEARERLADARRDLNARQGDFLGMLRAEHLLLDVRSLEYLAHWITPPGRSRRFDTRFFAVRAPKGQIAMHDEGETVANRWLTPKGAFAAHERGEIQLMLPTRRNLEAIAHLNTVDEVLAYAHGLESIPTVAPGENVTEDSL